MKINTGISKDEIRESGFVIGDEDNYADSSIKKVIDTGIDEDDILSDGFLLDGQINQEQKSPRD